MAVILRLIVLAAVALVPLRTVALEREGATEPVIDRHPVVAALLEQLDTGATGSELRQDELEGLKAYYEQPGARPIWTGDTEISKAAHDVSSEIARAGDYGLDPDAFKLPALDAQSPDSKQLGNTELQMSRAVLVYVRHAKGGRADPAKVGSQLEKSPPRPEPVEILASLATHSEPASYLRALHPTHPQFEALRKKLAALRGAKEERAKTQIPDGPALRLGTRHPQVAALRKRLNVPVAPTDGAKKKPDPELFDKAVQEAVKRFQKETGLGADGVVGSGTRRALNGDAPEVQLVKILINMERWRWLPADLDGDADIYVWANIPEYRVRIVRQGELAFSERVIVGKTNKRTPVFSDEMEWIEIHPTWYVPNSIKVEDILPSLRRRTSSVMKRYHLKLHCGRHGSDPKSIDWSSVDIRKCSVSQPPGAKSVLGDFKFKFPNKHAVYMHDTPTKGLFKRTTRTFSHGCVRIQNPRRMAEILLAHDKQMSAERLGEILAGPRRLHKEDLNRHVPVHITYFTAVFSDDGKFTTRPDIYGHDKRLAQVLMGKGHLMPAPPVAARTARKKKRRRPGTQAGNWWQPGYLQN